MSIRLFRIDERLIHGQVIMGWGRELQFRRYLVVDDELAESPWEQELYALALESDADVRFSSVEDARRSLGDWLGDDVPSVLLTRDPEQMARLAAGRLLEGREVNVGGLHHRPGRQEIRSYIHLDAEDRDALRSLSEEGVLVSGRDLPSSSRVSLEQLLR
jgi:PTS system mannose-specific IIB component/fructoselysine and glucoselysine-specific PTS system IIB component